MGKKHFVLLLFLFSYISTYGQAFSTDSWWSPETEKYSPVVTADGHITFRTPAPKAKEVRLLFGEWDVEPVNMHLEFHTSTQLQNIKQKDLKLP